MWPSLVARARLENNPALLCEALPYAGFVGLEAALGTEGRLICRLAYADHLIGNPTLPALHGGVIGALLESTAILHLLWETNPEVVPRTINMSFDFLRTGRPADTFAGGTVTKQGRRVANVRVEAWQESRDRPIAAAHGHFLLTQVEKNG